MKKIIVIAIFIAVAIAIFAVVAGQADLGKSAEKVEVAVEKKVKSEDLKKDVKMPLKTMKMQKIKLIDKEKLRKNIKEMKEKKGEKSDNTLNLPEKRESCGE